MNTEYQRITLDAYSRELDKTELLSRVLLNPNGEFVLQVEVPGPFNATADFRLDNSFSYMINDARLIGLYSSEISDEPIIESWTIKGNDAPKLVCAAIIQDFIENCVYKEHEKMVEVELVTEDNLEEFAMFLNDNALSDENIYAVGFRVPDVEIPVTAGAASFYLTDEDDLVIEDINILPKYTELGIEEFIISYISKKIFE